MLNLKTVKNAFNISIRNLKASRLRSFLTILGVIIGVGSVIIIFSIGKSAQKLVLDQITGVGSNLVAVLPGASDEDGPPAAVFGISVTTLKYEDLLAITDKRTLPAVEAGAGYVQSAFNVKSREESINATVVGTTESYTKVENVNLVKGRFFLPGEDQNLSKVAVLGSTAARDLFGDDDPLGEKIKIKNHSFSIIGVFKERGSAAFGVSSQDESIYVPLKTAQKLLLGIDHLGYARLKITDSREISYVIANVKEILRERHDISRPEDDDFSVRDQASALETLTGVTNVLRYFLLIIGVISLIVGGVGIMNIMLISVNQRIREVGTRKAVGAKNFDILLQFILESTVISILGGLLGIISGIVISFLVAFVAQKLGYEWEFFISFISILVAAIVSAAIGIIFGIYPARKASKVSPMEALRYE